MCILPLRFTSKSLLINIPDNCVWKIERRTKSETDDYLYIIVYNRDGTVIEHCLLDLEMVFCNYSFTEGYKDDGENELIIEIMKKLMLAMEKSSYIKMSDIVFNLGE